jgi:hypothetical protein
VAFLLGLGGAFHLSIAAAALWGLEQNTVATVLLPTLGWASVGAWIPHRLLAGMLKGLWRKVAGGQALREDLSVLLPRRRSHRVLLWLLMASIASLIGLAELMLILLNGWGASVGAYLESHFLWTAPTWFLARLLVIAGVLFLPSLLLGTAVAALGSLSSGHEGNPLRGPLPTLIVGGGIGLLVIQFTTPGWLTPPAGFLLASVPFFAASWVAGIAASWVEKTMNESLDEVVHVPTEASQDRFLIASALGVWGALTAVWVMGQPDGGQAQIAFLGGIGAGAATGEWWLAEQRHSRGGAGMAVWGLGLVSAVGTVSLSRPALFIGPIGKLILVISISAAIGFILPYLLRCLTSRSTTAGRSHSLATSLLMGSATLALLVSHLLPVGPQPWILMLAILSLLAIALGGLLVIHDEEAARRLRRNRLVMIFGGLIFLMVVFAWSNVWA